MRTAVRADPIAWSFAALLAIVCLGLAGRYDTFRNELYFIACGRHPAFGYADLPPLVALLAAATQLFGDHTWTLRLPAIAALVALVPLTAAFARTLGGNRTSAWMAGVAVGLAPVMVALAGTLTTSSFEPIAWTACAYLLARAAIDGDRRALPWMGVIAGLSLEAKYGIGIWLIALGIGVVLSSARRIFASRQLWYGALACAVIGAPSLIWQALHGWPFFVMIHYATTRKNLTGGPIRFEVGQVLAMNFVLAPLWIAGVVAPFSSARLRPARFLSIAFVAATAIVIGSHGKDYYLTPAYPTMFAAGAVACEGLARWLRALWFAAAAAMFIPVAPVVLPILDPPALARYLDRTHLRPRANELTAIGAPLTQVFSDELGWRRMEQRVAAVYRSLPPARAGSRRNNDRRLRRGRRDRRIWPRRRIAAGLIRAGPVFPVGPARLRRQRADPCQRRSGPLEGSLPEDRDCRLDRRAVRDAVRERSDHPVSRDAPPARRNMGAVPALSVMNASRSP